MPELDHRISLGSILNFISVAVAVAMLWFQQEGLSSKSADRQIEAANKQQTVSSELSSLADKVGELSDTVKTVSAWSTHLDDTLSQISKRVDSIGVSMQNINDRLVVQEAKAAAMDEEMKAIIALKESKK